VSLIVAYRGKGFQYWCSDGLVVSMAGSNLKVIRDSTHKIFQLRHLPVLVGYSGDMYDAHVIQRILEEDKPALSLVGFSTRVAHIVKSINSISEHYCLMNDEPRFETGLIVGGLLCQTNFLAIVTPKGEFFPMKTFAAIGKDSCRFVDFARTNMPRNVTAESLFDVFHKCFQLYWDCSPVSSGLIFPIILNTTAVVDLYKYSSELYHSSCYKDYVNCMKKKVVFSFS
jgi:hypothetical protein